MRPTRKDHHSLSILVALVAILVLIWLLRMHFWDQPLQMDEGVYGYMAWNMRQGAVPYKDIYDHKPPSIYLLYYLAFLLLEPTALNIRVFATMYTMGTVLAVFFLTRRIGGSKAGCLAALLFGIFSSGPRVEGGGVNTEIFMILPYTLAALSLLKAVESGERKHYVFFGLWTGLASTIKQVALVNLFWLAAYLLVSMWRLKDRAHAARSFVDGFLAAVGSIIPWFPFLAYFAWNGALGKFYFWVVSFNVQYVEVSYTTFSNLAILFHEMKSILSENGILWFLALAGIVYQWQAVGESNGTGFRAKPPQWEKSVWFLMTTWPLFSFLGVSLGGRFFGHYFIQIIPPLSVLGGVGLMGLARKVQDRGTEILRSPISLVLTLVFAKAFLLFLITDAPYYLWYNADQISFHQYRTPLFSVTRFVGNYLGERTKPDELVYVWAVDPEINFYALRKTPSPYLIHRREEKVPAREVIGSFQKAPPTYVVAMEGMERFPQLQDYVSRNYYEETDEDLEKLKQLIPFEIYRRRER